jgi:hypothetical protein
MYEIVKIVDVTKSCSCCLTNNEPLPEECGCKLALKFTALKFNIKPSLYRQPLALRERIFACETVEGLARSFMSFKKYKSRAKRKQNKSVESTG